MTVLLRVLGCATLILDVGSGGSYYKFEFTAFPLSK